MHDNSRDLPNQRGIAELLPERNIRQLLPSWKFVAIAPERSKLELFGNIPSRKFPQNSSPEGRVIWRMRSRRFAVADRREVATLFSIASS